MLFLGDGDAQPRAGRSGSSGSGSGSEWSIVFPVARGGAWRGSATPDEYPSIRQQGQEVRACVQHTQCLPQSLCLQLRAA
jgi:hypothetical protein